MERAWSIDRTSGVTLVHCRLHNDREVPRQVRIESLLEGPVLPPRRNGVPEEGWDRSGVTIRLDPGERRAVGFASPTHASEPAGADEQIEQRDPPVAITEVEMDGGETAVDGAAAIRRLGTHRPPGDVVARIAGDVGALSDEREVSRTLDSEDVEADTARDTLAADIDDDGSAESTGDSGAENTGGSGVERRGSVSGPIDVKRIEEWLDAVECRIERGERLTGATLAEATAEVDDVGGLEPLFGLDARLADDAALLRRIGDRMTSLAGRAEATDVPIGAMEKLA